MRFFLCFLIFIFLKQSVFAARNFYTPEIETEFKNKKRITEILRRDNFKLIEPYFYVSNRPTIAQALNEEFKEGSIISPSHEMVYCPPKPENVMPTETGMVYIGANNLPKNADLTNRWFMEAHRYRTPQDGVSKTANIVIVSPKQRNFLTSPCKISHPKIIMAAHNDAPQILREVPLHLPFVPEGEKVDTVLEDYVLPSKTKEDFNKIEKLNTEDNQKKIDLTTPPEIITIARDVASKQKVFVKLILAIAEVASSYNPSFVDVKTNNRGIMGTPPNIIKYYKLPVDSVLEAKISFEVGSIYIKHLYEVFSGDLPTMLRAYYVGVIEVKDIDKASLPAAEVFKNSVMQRVTPNQPILLE